jgi:hypothetical protein
MVGLTASPGACQGHEVILKVVEAQRPAIDERAGWDAPVEPRCACERSGNQGFTA